jgi:hypothetical protein
VLPDPGQASTLDHLAGTLRGLKVWAGDPSFETITSRVNNLRPAAEQAGKTTVVDCFRNGRPRLAASGRDRPAPDRVGAMTFELALARPSAVP